MDRDRKAIKATSLSAEIIKEAQQMEQLGLIKITHDSDGEEIWELTQKGWEVLQGYETSSIRRQQ